MIRLGTTLRVPRWALLELAWTGRVVCLPNSPLTLIAGGGPSIGKSPHRVQFGLRQERPGARSSGASPARRLARSPRGRGGSVDQLVLVPED